MDPLNNILNELYQLDPGLKNHEPALKKIIAELLASKPHIKIDEQFIKTLRTKLSLQADSLQTHTHSNGWFKLPYAVSAIAVIVIIGASTILYFNRTIPTPENISSNNQQLQEKNTILALGKNAFGSLAEVPTNSGRGSGGGGGNAASSYMAPEAINGDISTKMIAPDIMQPNYRFVYRGEPVSLSDTEVTVYRRVKGLTVPQSLANQIAKVNFGILNSNNFSQAKLDSYTLNQESDFGYSIMVNLSEGTINIYQNWSKWPQPQDNCNNEACAATSRIQLEQIPNDDEVIAIAQNFLKEKGISTQGYGTPFVQNDWRIQYDQMPDKAEAYIPEILNVTFPLSIGDVPVYYEGGQKAGLNINVDVRNKKVSAVMEITNQRFESSSYAAVTDFEEIKRLAEQGNFRYATPFQQGTITDIPLGTPSKGLVKLMQYTDGKNNELFVPALIFPVENLSRGNPYLYQTHVIIPLAKELLGKEQPPAYILEKSAR